MRQVPRNSRLIDNDDPTGEEEAPDFDPTRTDRIDAPEVDPGTTGIIERDDRGNAVWRVIMPTDMERTFDELRIFDNDKLAVEEPKPEPAPTPMSGYNPYETVPAKPPAKRR